MTREELADRVEAGEEGLEQLVAEALSPVPVRFLPQARRLLDLDRAAVAAKLRELGDRDLGGAEPGEVEAGALKQARGRKLP
jgi:hypothetical protein